MTKANGINKGFGGGGTSAVYPSTVYPPVAVPSKYAAAAVNNGFHYNPSTIAEMERIRR